MAIKTSNFLFFFTGQRKKKNTRVRSIIFYNRSIVFLNSMIRVIFVQQNEIFVFFSGLVQFAFELDTTGKTFQKVESSLLSGILNLKQNF